MNTILRKEEIRLTQRTYHTHRLLAQLAFSDDPLATELLQLKQSGTSHWLAEAEAFYQIAVPLAEFMQKCGVHKDELRQARAMVEAVSTVLSDN